MVASTPDTRDGAPKRLHHVSRRRRLLFIAFTSVMAFIAPLLVAECLFRAFPGLLPHELQVQLARADSTQALFAADALLEHRAVPGYDAAIPHSECPYYVRTVSLPNLPAEWGFRTPPLDPERPIRSVVLGDSMAFGYGVAEEETLAGRLRSEMEETGQVVNLGLSNKTGTLQYELILDRFLQHYRPAEVIILHFENDYTDDAFFEKWRRLVAVDPSLGYPMSRRIDRPDVGRLTWLKRQSLCAALVSNARRKLAANARRIQCDGVEYVPARQLLETVAPDNAEACRGYDLGLASLARMFAACRDASARVTVVMIPSKEQALAGEEELDTFAQFYQGTADFCREHGVAVVDLLPEFRTLVRRQQLYYAVDGHLTALGNAQAHHLLNSTIAARAESQPEHVARADAQH